MSNVINDVQSAPDTFTNWNKCMDKAYCKWPAIVGIIIGSLIVLSVLFCLVQCLCCGVSCAKMLCCCCRGCGRSKSREKPSRFQDNYQQMPPTPYSGYQPSPNPMTYRGAPSTATFDVSSGQKIHEDSLPPMPSWDTAPTRRIEDPTHEGPMEDVEMGRLAPIQADPQRMRNGYNQVPNGPVSPTSPTYNQNGYFATHPQNQNADLGAQRIGPYNDYDDIPNSPAPTYTTNPQPATDRFVTGAASAAPYSYQNHHPQSSYTPSSTQYQASDYASTHTSYAPSPYHSTSPPPMHGARPPSFGNNNFSPYGGGSVSPPQQDTGGRPPSLLQIGRRAVPGSQREV